jgi:hypothetical protein
MNTFRNLELAEGSIAVSIQGQVPHIFISVLGHELAKGAAHITIWLDNANASKIKSPERSLQYLPL